MTTKSKTGGTCFRQYGNANSKSTQGISEDAKGGLIFKTMMLRMVDQKATGEKIRELRRASGMSLREMARRLQISAPYLSDLELGRRNWTPKMCRDCVVQISKYKTTSIKQI